MYASPQATALVGIEWSSLRSTFLASDVRAELSAMHFPELACFDDAQQILISAPELLAFASGACPAAQLRSQAGAAGYKASNYRGVELWVAPGSEALSVAMFADRLLFIGKVPVLRETIDRTRSSDREYARLLARAAKYAKEDLWVVARRLPDPLASRFLPFDIKTLDFEGSVSFWEGMHLVTSMTTGGIRAAEDLAGSLQTALEERPELLEGSEVTLDRADVYVKMDLSEEQVATLGPRQLPAVAIAPVASAVPAPSARPPEPAAAKAEPAPPAAPPKPKVVRIHGMGERTVEIPMQKP